MKYLVAMLLIVVPFFTWGQLSTIQFPSDSTFSFKGKSVVSFETANLIVSNSINLGFANALFSNEFIDEDLKNKVRLNGDNFLLSDNRFAARFNHYSANSKNGRLIGWGLGVGSNYFSSANYSDDYFNLVFRGNSFFEGDVADLSKSVLSYTSYQSLSAYLLNVWDNNKYTLELNTGLSILKGQDLFKLDVRDAQVATALYGEEVTLDMDYMFYSSDTTASNMMSFSGLGAALNLDFSFLHKRSNLLFQLDLDNLGAINFNKNGQLVDTKVSAELAPTSIELFPDFDFDMGNVLDVDSLTDLFYDDELKAGSYRTTLPAQLHVSVSKIFSGKVFHAVSIGTSNYFNSTSVTILNLNTSFRISDRIYANLELGTISDVGEFASIQIRANIKDHVYAKLQYGDIIGLTDIDNAYMQQLNASLTFIF